MRAERGKHAAWPFLVIRDHKIKEKVGFLYKRPWDKQIALRYRAVERPLV